VDCGVVEFEVLLHVDKQSQLLPKDSRLHFIIH